MKRVQSTKTRGVYKYRWADGTIMYGVRYRYRGRLIRKKIGPDRKTAEAYLMKVKVQVAENRYLDIRKTPNILFEKFAKEYLDKHCLVHKRSTRNDRSIKNNLVDFFGGKFLRNITSEMVERYQAKRVKTRTKATVNRELAWLRHLFTKAIEWGKALENPVKKVKFFKENNSRLRYLQTEEIQALLDACFAKTRPIIEAALNTGMRKGELMNLRWSQVDMKNDFITVEKTKNEERRIIPMNATLKQVFEGLPRSIDRNGLVFAYGESKTPNPRKAFESAKEKAGIEDFRFHDMRHTFASHLVMGGADFKTIQELLGHKSLAMTMRYAHLSAGHKRKALQDLYSKVSPLVSPQVTPAVK